jgi:aryl-alcohol dehydrogenase-like predicted oxidoreductase
MPCSDSVMSLLTRRMDKDGLEVTGLGPGLMSKGNAYGHVGSDEESLSSLDKAYELGPSNTGGANIYDHTEDLLNK